MFSKYKNIVGNIFRLYKKYKTEWETYIVYFMLLHRSDGGGIRRDNLKSNFIIISIYFTFLEASTY